MAGPDKPIKARDAKWFWDKIARQQSNVMLRQLEIQDIPDGVDYKEVLDACLKDRGVDGRFSLTTVDEALLIRYLGKGKFPDAEIRSILLYGGAYAVLRLHRRRPDLLPAEQVRYYIEEEALELIDQHFVRGRQNDKRLSAFIRHLEKIPGFAEVIAVHHVHGY